MTQSPDIVRIVVLFQPPHDIVDRLRNISAAGWPVVAVYNAPDPDVLARLRADTPAIMLPQQGNQGLARALNAGIDHARALGATHVSLFDQDSTPAPDLEQRLLRALSGAGSDVTRIAVVGPTPEDEKDLSPGVEDARSERVPLLVDETTVISSGSLIPIAALDAVGPMWDELFIDDIDHEWCHRARRVGWKIVRARDVTMPHNLGDTGVNVFGRFKAIHRSPFRHYHILRNTLVMLRLGGIPLGWRAMEGLKTLYRLPAYIAFSSDRPATLRGIFRALRDHRRVLITRPGIWR